LQPKYKNNKSSAGTQIWIWLKVERVFIVGVGFVFLKQIKYISKRVIGIVCDKQIPYAYISNKSC